MQWFTREWANGDLTDEACEVVSQAYDAHLSAIAPMLPKEVRFLLGPESHVSLHDATFVEVQEPLETPGTLIVDMFAFDYEHGALHDEKYWTFPRLLVRIVYLEAEMISPESISEFELLAWANRIEIIRDEIDRTEDGRFEHRMLLAPWESPYIIVQFRDAAVRIVRLDGTDVGIIPTE